MDITYWLLFFSAAFLICISPGPDLLYIATKTTAQGAKSGAFAAMGINAGAFVHVLASALGIAAILAASAAAFTVIKLTGAAYLFYLGIRAIFAKKGSDEARRVDNFSEWKTFRQGFLVDLFNPKVSIFFMAFLPQFVRPELGHASLQIVFLGSLVILVGIIVELIFVFAVSKVSSLFTGKSKHTHLLQKLLGTTFIGLGVRLAFTSAK